MKQKILHLMFAVCIWASAQAQTNYPPSLTDERTGQSISASTTKCIILINGWNPNGAANCYDINNGFEWFNLLNNLKARLSGSSWGVIAYDWHQDASTGYIGDTIPTSTPQFLFAHANQAATNAQLHGAHLATQLDNLAPNLREVHIIAHSAGSWAARMAAAQLLQLNPYVIVQITLLDPYVPYPTTSTGDFSDQAMDDSQFFSGHDRIQRLENYYAIDNLSGWNPYPWGSWNWPTLNTQETFFWRSGIDINQEVDWGTTVIGTPSYKPNYDWHSGPIQFYADTVDANISGHTASSRLPTGSPYDYHQIGWYRSLFAWESVLPQITAQPADQTVPAGSSVTLTITANQADNIDWYVFTGSWIGSGTTLTLTNFTAANPRLYIARVSNSNGQLYSRPVTLTVGAATFAVTSVSPSALTGLPLPQTQLFKIYGSGFTASSTLTFNDGVDSPFMGKVPTFISANELDYNIAVGTNQANWTVQVVSGAQQSNLGYFTVAAAAPPTSGSLIVTLSPSGAVSAGAQWQVDNGVYHSSGAVVTNLSAGSHTVACTSITGYSAPVSHSVSITNGTVTFDTENYTTIPNIGSLTVYISPSSAVSSGALWQVDGGGYHNNGDTVNNLSAGTHLITFNSIAGYVSPSAQQVTIVTGGSLTAYTTYGTAYSVITSALPYGEGGATGGGTYAAGSSITVSATPRFNYAFVNWTENGSVVSTDLNYTFALNANRNLVANFRFWGPSFFVATAVSKSAFGLTWDSYANSQASLIIEKTNETTGTFDVVSTLPTGTTAWVDTNVVPNHNYSYRIRSWDGIQNYSAYSPVSAQNTQPIAVLGAQSTLANGGVNYASIASDHNNVYWSVYYSPGASGYGGSIWKISKADGTLTPLATGVPGGASITVYSNYLYWAEGSGLIKMISINGGSFTTIIGNNSSSGISLLVDQSGVYWAEGPTSPWTYTGRIRGIVGVDVTSPTLLSQTSPITLADNRFQPSGISLDNSNVYWLESDPFSSVTNRGAVMRVSKLGGVPFALANNVGEADGISVDSTSVYFGVWNGSVYKVTKAGGSLTNLGGYASSPFLAVDNNYVYYTSLWGGEIGKILKNGGSSSALASGLTNPWGIAADSTGVYWTEEPTTWPPNGKIGMFGFVAPQITIQPQSQTVSTNVVASFSVTAYGTASLNYQWQQNGSNLTNGGNLSGVNTSTLTISGTQPNNYGNYTVVITNLYGAITSSPAATLIVLPNPIIYSQPYSQQVFAGDSTYFSVSVDGSNPISYRWLKNGIPLSDDGRITGSATSFLNFENTTMQDAGNYSVVVTSSYSSVTSSIAALIVLFPLGQALEATNLLWSTWGYANWVTQTNTSHGGGWAAQSGQIGNDQYSIIGANVFGPGTLTFWWKVSSEAGYDSLNFFGSGRYASISGEVDWQQVSFKIDPGLQGLFWTYSKDASVYDGQDAGWLDQVTFVPFQMTAPTRKSDGTIQMGLAGTPAGKYIIFASSNLVNWLPISTNSVPFGGMTNLTDPASKNIPMRFYRAQQP